MCEDADEGNEITREWRRARKTYKCFACYEQVRIGDRYHVSIYIEDSKFAIYRHCARCWSIILALWHAGAYSVQWDLNCGTEWEDAFDSPIPDDVAALAFMTPDEAQALMKDTEDPG